MDANLGSQPGVLKALTLFYNSNQFLTLSLYAVRWAEQVFSPPDVFLSFPGVLSEI